MRTPARGYGARRGWLGMNPAALAAIVLMTAFGGAWIAGLVHPLTWFRAAPGPDRRGLVPIPSSAVGIAAYTKITRDHVWNPRAGEFSVIYLRPEQVPPEVFRTVNAVIGRVMDHDKPAGYVFTESDFLPKGTRPGLTAGIPAGKRAMRIPVDRIPGLIGLLPGDRFDLVSTQAIDAGGLATSAGGLYGKQIDVQARLMNLQRQATVLVVVQNAQIVEPMQTRQVPVANTSLTSGLTIRTKPVQEVVIAVTPAEVSHLTEALAVGGDIACVPRSGRPDDPHDSLTPDSMPISPFGGRVARNASGVSNGSGGGGASAAGPASFGAGFTPIETIEGNKREIIGTPIKK
jgi:Flp pilus assembly protein CpaB